MTVPIFPLPVRLVLGSASGGPLSARISFQPDQGPPIERRATTARGELWQVQLSPISLTDLATFETWFNEDLAGGVLSFLFCHPVTRAFGLWKIEKADPEYSVQQSSTVRVTVSFRARLMPTPVVQADWTFGTSGVIEAA